MSETRPPADYSLAAEKVRSFPQTPGVYLMKDEAGRVIYVGKAKNLRSRAGSYFLKAAAEDPRTAQLVLEIRDIDYLDAESEIDALLMEARLIKDILPKFNRDLRDNKTFPYLEIFTHEDFPRVRFTREPRPRGTKLYGPFANPRGLRGAIQVLQKIFKFRTCSLDIDAEDRRWQWFRPCLLHSIAQCTAPCNFRITKEDYRKNIQRLQRFLDGGKSRLLGELREEMAEASQALNFEEAARLRDEIEMLESLNDRGELETHVQPEVFPIDPKRGLAGLKKVLRLDRTPRTLEGIDIAHTGGADTVASLVQFIDGLPFKPGYRRMRIRSVAGPDDTASIFEAVARRFEHLEREGQSPPDLLLVDGGLGQLHAAMSALQSLGVAQRVISLAKREELVFQPDEKEPLRLSRHSYALRLLQYVRDEAHRFAQHYHHLLRKRSQLGDAGE
ncbi:MAG: excinuclease ABC subunit UvrC [Planctomycetaceae bacterium]|nr:excinuclease ABC subunit UvrC [Planctomycetaceae bacterium]